MPATLMSESGISAPSLTIESIGNIVRRLAPKYPLQAVGLFGSRARGDFRPDSDVDLLVVPGPGSSLGDIEAFRDEARGAFGADVDVVSSFAGTTCLFRDAVKRDARLLYACA